MPRKNPPRFLSILIDQQPDDRRRTMMIRTNHGWEQFKVIAMFSYDAAKMDLNMRERYWSSNHSIVDEMIEHQQKKMTHSNNNKVEKKNSKIEIQNKENNNNNSK